ncbi:ATP-binding protein [uncultured Roseibium sp.]|uniref:ATP-binding protein n=1 Tax=uncultured Roseibium sp. TaxID=1936171 RepID=UPI002609743C|nr:ATP-binding protein [uncultured Roseibium sp.]
MDEQTLSFLELTAMDDLVQLVADKRAAWLWSADGARILWANAAGASFFSAQSVADLANLTSLERSPARPHIARIAESGPTDKFSIDRLRFYRGLRVMLLTCQCMRIELENGEAAALIVCGDKGLSMTKDAVPAFAQILRADDATVFVTDAGSVEGCFGELKGTPEDLDLPEGQTALFGPLELDGDFHEGVVLKVTDRQKLVVLENLPLADPDTEAGEDSPASAQEADASAIEAGLLATGVAAGAAVAADTSSADGETVSRMGEDNAGWVRADEDEFETADDMAATQAAPASTVEEPVEEDLDNVAAKEQSIAAGVVTSDDISPMDAGEADLEAALSDLEEIEEAEVETAEDVSADAEEDDGLEELDLEENILEETTAKVMAEDTFDDTATEDGDGFVFQPRRRPVRFAWKMDIDQRFTFLSDEFAEVLGPSSTDIIGLTWKEVSDAFDLDPRGHIARALDRRDTWSGKTIDWPVSGAELRVPVDMAALPAFDRNRKFEGYRGFGVCRTADAVPEHGSQPSGPTLAVVGASDTDNHTDETERDTLAEDETTHVAATLQEGAPGAEAADVPVKPEVEDDITTAGDDNGHENVRSETGDETTDTSTGEAGTDEAGSPDAAEQQATAEAAAKLAELKPAKPDSFAGKTFLGASAAALVGSLAKFTGKAPQRPADPPVKADEPAKADTRHLETDASPEDVAPDADKDFDDLPGAALDSKFKALESGLQDAPEDEDLPEESDLPETAEDKPVSGSDDTVPEDVANTEDTGTATDETEDAPEAVVDDADAVADDEDPEDEVSDIASEDTAIDDDDTELADEDENEADADSENDAGSDELPGEETKDTTTAVAVPKPASAEPTGISGPAALKPAEIESAVKSLAKAYKEAEKKSRDLFEEEEDPTTPENDDMSSTAVATAGSDEDQQTGTDEASAEDEDLFEPEPAFEDTHFDLVEEEDREIEAVAASLETDDAAEEREFFEETAAFESEDKAAETADADEPAEPKPTGQVIPLATVKPRVVPVDTSGLSRPERQAFRKIAEALGARLEGDLEDFDAPDPVEPVEELPPEVPEAGPIDPSLLDRLPIGIAIAHDREVLYANKALLSMLGYKSITALSEAGGLEALFIDDAEELPDAEGMDGEVDETMKMRLSDGGVLNVDAHMHSVPWNGTRGLMISITERKAKPAPATAAPSSPNFFAEVRSELDSARNQIAEMDTILETATDGVLVLDQNGTILKVNGSAEALFSANRSDMIGAPFTDFLAPESHRAAADYLDGLSRNGVASILNDGREVLGKVPTGGLIPLFMTIGRISGNKDDVKYCAVLRDITQWKTAEEELTQAKRQAENASSQKSDFLAKISHEIRTPLNAIIGFSEVMMEERFGPIGNDRYKDYLKDIRTSGSHIMSLINDLLDLSKIEAGKLDLKFSAVSTNDVINECVALMQPQANRERVIIRASLPESVPDVVADPRSLRQIVLNLLSNAIKYNKSGGQVILSTALESNGEVALRVRDTGTGMTAKQLAAALEPFRQLHTSSRGGGTGLGLPLTKALVEANRASFHIDSTPDQGTLVEIIFPTQRVLSE